MKEVPAKYATTISMTVNAEKGIENKNIRNAQGRCCGYFLDIRCVLFNLTKLMNRTHHHSNMAYRPLTTILSVWPAALAT